MNAEAALRRALLTCFASDNVSANIGNIRSHAWASITFSGMRHELNLQLAGSGVDALIAEIGEREFELPGHILIDIAAREVSRDREQRALLVEALTVAAD